MTARLNGARVFVSASFPSGKRGERFRPYDTAAIADAATAIVQAVLLAGGRIVFGAHPTISPLVLLVAGELGRREVVEVYQSRWYEGMIPKETERILSLGLGVPRWTERVPGADEEDSGPSLKLMREKMLGQGEPLSAGVFIGGMEGIFGEYDVLVRRRAHVPRLPLTAPGGAARKLAPSHDRVAERLAPVLGSPRYPELARRVVAELSEARRAD